MSYLRILRIKKAWKCYYSSNFYKTENDGDNILAIANKNCLHIQHIFSSPEFKY